MWPNWIPHTPNNSTDIGNSVQILTIQLGSLQPEKIKPYNTKSNPSPLYFISPNQNHRDKHLNTSVYSVLPPFLLHPLSSLLDYFGQIIWGRGTVVPTVDSWFGKWETTSKSCLPCDAPSSRSVHLVCTSLSPPGMPCLTGYGLSNGIVASMMLWNRVDIEKWSCPNFTLWGTFLGLTNPCFWSVQCFSSHVKRGQTCCRRLPHE